MSASTERKMRQAARAAGTDKKMLAAQVAAKQKKKSLNLKQKLPNSKLRNQSSKIKWQILRYIPTAKKQKPYSAK